VLWLASSVLLMLSYATPCWSVIDCKMNDLAWPWVAISYRLKLGFRIAVLDSKVSTFKDNCVKSNNIDHNIFIQICAVGSKRRIFSAPEFVLAIQGYPRSIILVAPTSRKRVCDFLLVRHCDYGPILHRFWDTATYWLQIAYFSYPSLIRRPRSLCSLWNFAVRLTMRKLESWSYPTVKTAWS